MIPRAPPPMPRSSAWKPPSTAGAASIPSFCRATPGRGLATSSPAIRCACPRATSASAMAAARMHRTSTTPSNRKIREFRGWTARRFPMWSSSTSWRKQAERVARSRMFAPARGHFVFPRLTRCDPGAHASFHTRSIKMKVAVMLVQPDGGAKQTGELLLVENGVFGPVGENSSLAQKNDAFNFWNDFGNMVGDEQNTEARLRERAHRAAKLQLRRNIESVARLIEEQRPRVVRQRTRNKSSLRFAAAVRTEDANVLAGGDFKRDVLEAGPLTAHDGDPFKG